MGTRRTTRAGSRATAAVAACVAVVALGAGPLGAAPPTADGPTAAGHATAWLADQLDAGIPMQNFGSPDWGVTLDAALGMLVAFVQPNGILVDPCGGAACVLCGGGGVGGGKVWLAKNKQEGCPASLFLKKQLSVIFFPTAAPHPVRRRPPSQNGPGPANRAPPTRWAAKCLPGGREPSVGVYF